MIGTAGIARPQEIGVQRMRRAAVDGAAGRDQRLADHLPAEHALPADLRARAAEQILLERLEVEDGEKLVEGAAHDVAAFTSFASGAEPQLRARSEGLRFPLAGHMKAMAEQEPTT